MKKHPSVSSLYYRNSITTPEFFNAFLSDLDVSIIIRDESDLTNLVRTYLKIKSFLIMLDNPEIYTEKEFNHLKLLKDSNLLPLAEFTLNFRKISWCN